MRYRDAIANSGRPEPFATKESGQHRAVAPAYSFRQPGGQAAQGRAFPVSLHPQQDILLADQFVSTLMPALGWPSPEEALQFGCGLGIETADHGDCRTRRHDRINVRAESHTGALGANPAHSRTCDQAGRSDG